MTAYRDFIKDFPSRCYDILKNMDKWSKFCDREVTLSISIACSGFVIPFDRLNPDAHVPHPSNDRNTYINASKKIDELMGTNFIGSELHQSTTTKWKFGKVNKKNIKMFPERIDSFKPKPISNEKTTRSILKIIRNSLAHGNIYTKGNPIELLIFLTGRYDNAWNLIKYEFVSMPPYEFVNFLTLWFEFLKENKLSIHKNISRPSNAA